MKPRDYSRSGHAGRVTALRVICLAVVVGALSQGCAFNRKTQSHSAETVAAAHESTIRRTLSGPVTPNVTVSGSSNVVTIVPSASHLETLVTDQANTKGEASGSNRSEFRASLSTWLAVAAAALALGALLVAYVIWRNSTASGRVADESVASVIRGVRARMASSVDAREIASLSPIVADLESARGRMK